MSSLPTGATETYLDVLRTLGVTDAELRRHHRVAADEPLRAAIAATLDAPTEDLLTTLVATGRVLDCTDDGTADGTAETDAGAENAGAGTEETRTVVPAEFAFASDDCEQLGAALGRFGYALEVATVGDDLELVAYDAVQDDVTRVRAAPNWDAVLEGLDSTLFEAVGIELVPLLDGRALLVDARRLERLRVAYGPRVEPFETPLFASEAAETVPERAGHGTVAGDWAGGAAAIERARSDREPAAIGRSGRGDDSGDDDVLEAPSAGAEAADTVDTADASLELDADRIGGGPDRTVSTSGIDEVFDQLESDAEPDHASSTDAGAVTATSADDPLEGWDGPDDEASDPEGGSVHLAGGGPKRTVSRTSADDILDRAAGEPDFESIAAEHGEADPDAVADDATEVSELAAAVSDVQSDPDAEEPTVQELIDAAAGTEGDEPFDIEDVRDRAAEVLDRASEDRTGRTGGPDRDEDLVDRLQSASER